MKVRNPRTDRAVAATWGLGALGLVCWAGFVYLLVWGGDFGWAGALCVGCMLGAVAAGVYAFEWKQKAQRMRRMDAVAAWAKKRQQERGEEELG